MGGYEAALGETSIGQIVLIAQKPFSSSSPNQSGADGAIASERLETVRPAILEPAFQPLSKGETSGRMIVIGALVIAQYGPRSVELQCCLLVKGAVHSADDMPHCCGSAGKTRSCSSISRASRRLLRGRRELAAARQCGSVVYRRPGALADLGQRMLAARLLDKAVIIRELMPQDLKIGVDR